MIPRLKSPDVNSVTSQPYEVIRRI